MTANCKATGCKRPKFGRTNFCRLCLDYFRQASKLGRSGYVKFTDQIAKDDCWTWTGPTTAGGYGLFRTEQGWVQVAHRAAFEHYVGPVPKGLHLDHLCRNRACVNPAHLEPVTASVNMRRKKSTPKGGEQDVQGQEVAAGHR